MRLIAMQFVKKLGGSLFGADGFDIKNVDSLNKALDNIPGKDNVDNYNIMVVFNWVYSMAALVAVGYIVYAAILYGTSEGDQSKAKKATSTITYAVIGLIIVALAWAITTFIARSIS